MPNKERVAAYKAFNDGPYPRHSLKLARQSIGVKCLFQQRRMALDDRFGHG
jgi:hypothetical protein